jgi:ABC-2 type transport system ATP-binding protein
MTDGAPEIAVLAHGLTRHFRAVRAVDDLTFGVRRGELFGLVGPDGAGKTTTLRMLAGILRPTAGDATVGGASVTRDPEGVKRRIAYMAQRFGLYADLTVAENLRFYADLYEVPAAARPARLERLYRFSNLGPFADRLAGKLSGGMKQKLALSCCLVHTPEILLLDEPTFGVDPISRRDLWLIVHDMVAAGVTAIVSTAYMDEAERCDRVALLDRGRLLALDTPAALMAAMRGEILAIAVADPRGAREAILRHPAAIRAAIFGDRLHVTVAAADRDGAAVTAALGAAGFAVASAERIAPGMEDVFIDLIATAGEER